MYSVDTYLNAYAKASGLILSLFRIFQYLLRSYQQHITDLELAKQLGSS